jgi:hypothetical protein
MQIGIPCAYSYRNSPQRSDYRSEHWLQVAMHVGLHDTPATERWYRQVFRRAGQCARFGTRRSETAQNDAADGRRHHGNSAGTYACAREDVSPTTSNPRFERRPQWQIYSGHCLPMPFMTRPKSHRAVGS